MALSMEERRILAQIEIHLSEDDPRLAHRLEKFGRPGRTARPRPRPRPRPRSRRARTIAVVTVAVLGVAAAIATAILTAILTAFS